MTTLNRRRQSDVKVQFAAKTVFFQHVSTRNICRLSSSFKFQSSLRSSGKNSSKKALDIVNKAKQLYGHSSACHKDPSTSLFEAGRNEIKTSGEVGGEYFINIFRRQFHIIVKINYHSSLINSFRIYFPQYFLGTAKSKLREKVC